MPAAAGRAVGVEDDTAVGVEDDTGAGAVPEPISDTDSGSGDGDGDGRHVEAIDAIVAADDPLAPNEPADALVAADDTGELVECRVCFTVASRCLALDCACRHV